MDENKVTYFAQTDSRNKKVPFGLKAKDRTKHVYVIGKTGMGKSTLLENMAAQDIQNGEGICFVDPHGKTAELLLEYVPEHRINDVLYFAPFDLDYPICFNVLEKVDADKRHLVVSGLMSTFKKIWADAWSARMEYILSNTLLALLEFPDATLLGVNRMLADKDYRKKVVDNVTDPSVKSFWVDEFAKYTERFAAEATPAIQNKIGQFTSNALIRNMIGQPESSFDFRQMMDEKKIIIVNLSKGRIGESNANLLGGMLITKIYLSAMSRADVPDRVLKVLPNFYLFVDEFQSFANESFADILSEARKYKLNLTMAHQYIEQMEEEVRAAVFGNVGTMIVFRVGAYDAEVLEKEFAPQFTAEDIVNLGAYQIYLKLMIDGISSAPFSASTLPPIKQPEVSNAIRVVEASRAQFAKRRSDVEANITKWHEPLEPMPSPKNRDKDMPRGPKERPSGSAKLGDEVRRQIMEHDVKPKSEPVPQHKTVEVPVQPRVVPAAPQFQSQSRSQSQSQPYPQSKPHVSKNEPERGSHTAPLSHSEPSKKAEPAFAPEIPKAEPVSLDALKKPQSNKNNGKVLTPQNLNELKNALAQVLKNPAPQQVKHEEPPVRGSVNGSEKGIKGPEDLKNAPPVVEQKSEEAQPKQEQKQKEIPEEVLANILRVDK